MTTERGRTRVLVVVHSHNNGVIDCSNDVHMLNTTKTIKGTGGFSFTLVARRNYLNLLDADDVVNIYVDPGDGKRGFVRVMMGYIDRVEISETTAENGATSTSFVVTGTDFTKAIDKTEIYFNPQLADRQEFIDPRFGLSQLGGGHALRTRGIVAHGTPAQFVENLLQLLLGFGSQWVLPRSYPTSNFLSSNRAARRQRAKQQLPKQIRDNLRSVFGSDIEQIGIDDDIELELLLKQFDLENNARSKAPTGPLNQDYYSKQAVISDLLTSNVLLQAYQSVIRETQSNSPASILDLLSFDFIEALTVDGYIQSSSVWTNQGPLASMLYGWSNEMVNELCFDLRPVVVDAQDDCFGTQYSTEEDELGYNVFGTQAMPASVAAIKYTPAVVFREYPYATVEGLDLSKFYVLESAVGFVPFGPIFAREPNVAGRKLYNYQNAGVEAITPEKCAFDASGAPLKHLDVVVIHSADVKDLKVGKSDQDIFNLFELYASSPTPNLWKYLIREILPVLTPVSIQRHGLRLRQLTTKFANYGRDQLCSANSSGVDNGQIRRNLIRWTLLLDHWYQHNGEYLTGTMVTRPLPEVRVGYRLDHVERAESYYVESVQHQWQYPGAMSTTLQVSRGQRNDPMPAYIPPILAKTAGLPAGAPTQPISAAPTVLSQQDQLRLRLQQSASVSQSGGGDRTENGRLAKSFVVRDTPATARAVGGEAKYSGANDIDLPENISGAAEFPNQSAGRDAPVSEQVKQQSIPEQGRGPGGDQIA